MTVADWPKGVLGTLSALRAQYPAAFAGRPRPLKIKIHDDIIARATTTITPTELSRALGYHTKSDRYLRSMRDGAPRIDLDGNEIGAVTSEQATGAKAILDARKAKKAVSVSVSVSVSVTTSAETETAAPAPPPPTPKPLDPDEQARLARERYRRLRGLGVRV